MPTEFIRLNNRVVSLSSIAYIDWLESGRAMIFVSGLIAEKQHISVDADEARRLREFFDSRAHPLSRGTSEVERSMPQRLVGRSVA